MIDSDQVLENAQETGYRLCSTGKLSEDDTMFINDEEDVGTKRIFSAQFDANNSNRLFVCTQDGQLRVYTLGQKEAPNTYRVLFRHCISSFEMAASEPGVPIHQHWDKMLTIPDRPHEIIFLLGVTKTLMYTALPGITGPYPEDPFLANTTRCDFKEYIYGTPVMELWSHESRITAMAVSQFGHILASGDEDGKIKLLLLRLLDDLSLVADNKTTKKKHAPPVFEANRPEYKLTLHVHNAPIFSLQFLPIVCEFTDSAATRVYCLATGSIDRVVRLWKVKCSTREGLGIYPLLNLDILLTNVLSLSTCLEESIMMEGDHRLANYMSLLKSGKKTAAELAGKRKQKYKVLGKYNYELCHGYGLVPSNVYLAGGTNFGSVYLWKFDFNALIAMITDEQNKLYNDDGSYVHSLVQSSDRPIIHLALSSTADRYSYEDAITITADTPPIEVLHKYAARTKRVVLAVADMIGVVRAHGEVEMVDDDDDDEIDVNISSNVSLSSSKKAQKKNVLALIGESVYDSVVVGCTFKSHNVFEELHGSSKLFICTSDNVMQLFRSDALTALQRPGAKSVVDEHYDQVDTTWNKAGTYTAPSSSGGVIPPTVRPQRSNIFDKHHDLPNPTPETYPQLSSLTYKENEKDAEPNPFPPKMIQQTSMIDRRIGSKSDMSQRGDDDVTVKSIPASNIDDQSQRPSILKRDSFDQKAFDTMSVMTDTRTEVTRGERIEKESVYTTRTGKSKVLPKDPDTIKFEDATSEISTSPKKVDNKVLVLDAMKKLEQKKQERAAKKKEDKLTAELTESEYLQPRVNSSKGVYDQLMELQREIENDMISVGSIDTCSTDRREAAKIVDMAIDERRYKELKPFVDPSDLPKPRTKKLPPQIDPVWKKRQEDTAPTKQDLEKLYKPDPLVKLKLKFSKENNSSPNNKKKDRDDLKLEFNSSTLLPEFSMIVNIDDIFGPIDAAKSWELIEKDIANARDINYCNRRTLF